MTHKGMFYSWFCWQMSAHLGIPGSKTPRLYWWMLNHCYVEDTEPVWRKNVNWEV